MRVKLNKGNKLEINSNEISKKSPSIYKLNSTHINTSESRKNQDKKQKILGMESNENTTY